MKVRHKQKGFNNRYERKNKKKKLEKRNSGNFKTDKKLKNVCYF